MLFPFLSVLGCRLGILASWAIELIHLSLARCSGNCKPSQRVLLIFLVDLTVWKARVLLPQIPSSNSDNQHRPLDLYCACMRDGSGFLTCAFGVIQCQHSVMLSGPLLSLFLKSQLSYLGILCAGHSPGWGRGVQAGSDSPVVISTSKAALDSLPLPGERPHISFAVNAGNILIFIFYRPRCVARRSRLTACLA